MVGESSTRENQEAESNPETAVENAVSKKEATQALESPDWVYKAKDISKDTALTTGVLFGASLLVSAKLLFNLFKFAKKAIEKGGKVGFASGYELGEDVFPVDKKDKK